MGKLFKFVKDWMLVIGMVLGATIYLIYLEADFLHPYGQFGLEIVKVVQPTLLFLMLFLSFSKIAPSDLKLHWWQLWILLIQAVFYVVPALVIVLLGGFSGALADVRVIVESFMLCMICPTATACSVMTAKLGGDRAGVMTYTIIINLLVAVVVPLMVPLMHPMEGLDFWNAFFLIISKVFPMLILPCLLAWLVRYTVKPLHNFLQKNADLAFVLWACSLIMAIMMGMRAIVHSSCSALVLVGIAAVSLVACVFQFMIGKRIGGAAVDRISAGQAMGQKNTVFAIWMAYTFMNPLICVAGGFYTIWHNVFNSIQLYYLGKGKTI